MAPPRDLIERTRLFSLAVVEFCRQLPKTAEAQEMAGQLRRAANGVRMNYRAARRGRSRAEFRAKLGTVFEEVDESADALRYFRDARIRHDPDLVNEAEELARIFATAVKTARGPGPTRPRRPERPPEDADNPKGSEPT